MFIQSINVLPVYLPMKQNFSISGGQVGSKDDGAPHVYVKITTDDGIEGWGEARPSHRWSYETMESVVSTIENYLAPILKNVNIFDIKKVHLLMNQQIANGVTFGQPIAKAAVDMAVMDAIGKTTGQPLSQVWLSGKKDRIDLSYLISAKTESEAAEKAHTARSKGFSGVDVKIGMNPKKDIAILNVVKEIMPDSFFRVDANQAYQLKEAMQLCRAMEDIGVDVFEQPLAAGDFSGHAKLRDSTTVPIALDESVWTPEDTIRAIQQKACDVIVIKVTKMGGPSRAKKCGEIAEAAGLGLLGGGLTESTLGLYASAYVFHALGISTPVDLNGPLFLEDDPSEDVAVIHKGSVQLPGGYGIGWEVDENKLKQFSIDS